MHSTPRSGRADRSMMRAFGSRGGLVITAGSGGSRLMMITGITAITKFRNRTCSGSIATPSLMLKAVAIRNMDTRANNWVIW